MTADFVIFVDFDSTLYDTAAFADDLWSMIAEKAGMTLQQAKQDGLAYFFHPTLGGYEYERHAMKYGFDSEEMWQELDRITQSHDYLYPDSAEFMHSLQADSYTPKILTFGEKRFQLAKIKPVLPHLTAPGADAIEVIVVDKKKNEHIAALHPGERGVLIDDKPDQDLPDGFTEIHLNRAAGLKFPESDGNVIRVSTLTQARKAIDSLAAALPRRPS